MRPYEIIKIGTALLGGGQSSQAATMGKNANNSSAATTSTNATLAANSNGSVTSQISAAAAADVSNLSSKIQTFASLKPAGGIGSITLPIPPNINDANHYQFTQSAMGRAYGILEQAALGVARGNAGAAKDKARGDIRNAMIQNVIKNLGAGLLSSDAQGLQATLFGAPNPFMKINFTQSNFKNHQFIFILVPRNAQDSAIIRQIISILRYFSAPVGRDSSIFDVKYGWLLEYSAEVQSFTYKFNPCYLTDMNVAYNSFSGISSWHSDGAPSDIILTLNFTEMVVTSQETYDGQFSNGSSQSPNAYLDANGIGVSA